MNLITIQLSEEQLQDLNRKLDIDTQLAKQHYEDYVEQRIIESDDMYYADEKYYDKKFPNSSKKSKLVSTDIADTIEWAMPHW